MLRGRKKWSVGELTGYHKDIGRISLKRGGVGSRDMQGCFIVRIFMNYPFVLD